MSESTALNKMLLPELKAVAASMGIRTAGLRKAELVAAINQGSPRGESSGRGESSNRGEQASEARRSRSGQDGGSQQASGAGQSSAQSDGAQQDGQDDRPQRRRRAERPSGAAMAAETSDAGQTQQGQTQDQRGQDQRGQDQRGQDQDQPDQNGSGRRNRRRNASEDEAEPQHSTTDEVGARLAELSQGKRDDRREPRSERRNDRNGNDRNGNDRNGHDRQQQDEANQGSERSDRGNDRNGGEGRRRRNQQNDQSGNGGNNQGGRGDRNDSGNRNDQGNRNDSGNRNDQGDDEFGGGRRGRRRRQRDRQSGRRRGQDRFEAEPTVQDDDVLVNISGIVDISDNFATVRTSGYLPGPSDGYLSMAQVRKYNLRKGDVVTGALRQAREGERREKFSPVVRVDTVNGVEPEQMANRPEFNKLTPLYPQEKLRLETVANNMTGRIIDLVSPIGKGQRGLIVAPPKAGKTMIMQSIANSIAANNPEVHLMVVLVDERPEEVTDFQRTVSGEVIASTFDRPASDHTQVSELAIERAKRLVELGHDVVVLLDGITRLGRAYNLAAPASGRILSGGVDSAALYPPKKFFGAARNIENGGSLTILATALVETGSRMDEVIFEEFKGTGNMELRLSRSLSDKRVFPAIDVNASGTRREELLLGREELSIMWKLRRVMSGLDDTAGSEMLLSRLRKTQNNNEFLVMISKTTPSND